MRTYSSVSFLVRGFFKKLRVIGGFAFGSSLVFLIGFAFPVASAAETAPSAATDSGAHPVFDFDQNRSLAHLDYHGGLLILAGSPGFAKYVHFGRPQLTWKFVVSVDGIKVALASPSATLQFPLTKEQTQNPRISLSLKVEKPSSVKIHVGEQVTKLIPLKKGWQTVEGEFSSGSLHEGENMIRLEFAQKSDFLTGVGKSMTAAAAIEWIQIGGKNQTAQEKTIPSTKVSTILHRGDNLVIPGQGALYYYIDTAGGFLVAKSQGNGCTLKVSLSGDGKEPERYVDVSLDGRPVPLVLLGTRPTSMQVRRVGLHAEGETCQEIALSQIQIMIPGAAPQVQRPSKPKNIVFWLSDDTRADKFKLWNPNSRVETPVLDTFSQKATRFETAYAQGNESRISHASLFTGMYPKQHNFISEKAILGSKWITLAEAVRPAGLFTIGEIANGFITKRWGFGEGWDVLKNHIHDGGGLKAEDLVSNVRDFLNKGQGKDHPFFFYIGSIDAHVSWRAHEPWISKYDKEPYHGLFTKALLDPQLDQVVAGTITLSERDKTRVIALYDSDISYTDEKFGELLKILEETGHENDTMIVFTSDHGEEFWDHGHIGHGQSLHSELVHVPLWIYYPPLFPGGKVVKEGVELIDLLPTLTDALGLEAPKDVQGESLLPLAQGIGSGYPRPAISSQYELAYAMRLGNYKIWIGGAGDMKLFDVHGDRREEKDLSKQDPIHARFVMDPMSLWVAYQSSWKKARWGVASNQLSGFANDLESNSSVLAFDPSHPQ